MKPILEQWLADVANRQTAQLSQSGLVEGVRDRPLGPRSDFAKITVAFEPASALAVECSAPNRSELEADRYLEGAVFGLLDVLLTAGTYPLRNVKLTITAAEIHPIHSSQMAFRWAGRDAATKLLEAIQPKLRVS
jgi:translation elongation factor EF-G